MTCLQNYSGKACTDSKIKNRVVFLEPGNEMTGKYPGIRVPGANTNTNVLRLYNSKWGLLFS